MEIIAATLNNDPLSSKNISFEGKLIARVTSKAVTELIAKGLDGNLNTGWLELTLYRANTGEYICQRIHRDSRTNIKPQYEGTVCEDLNEVIRFFGSDWLARELFEEANIAIDQTSGKVN